MSKRRVVITGLGMVTSIGNCVQTTWDSLIAGKSNVTLIDEFDTSAFGTKFAAQVQNFPADDYISPKDHKKMDVFIQYGMAAGIQAVNDSGLDLDNINKQRIGVSIGSGIGGLTLIEANHSALINNGPRRVSPFFVPSTIVNMLAGQLSIKYQLQGPNITIATACSSGVHNIGNAARIIAYGDAEVMLAGGAEKASTPLGMAGFAAAKALSSRNDSPQTASRPWDIDRDGFVLGDGAGIIVLEEYEHAKARNANIYAEVVGFGMSGDGFHMTSPPEDGAGAALSMANALQDAKVNPDQVGYINAHGTSTKTGDIAEANAVENIFASCRDKIMLSSTKSITGHLLGAAGAIESIFSILALKEQIVPPTINLENQDPLVTLDLIPNTARQVNIEYALNNSFGFGGTNGSVLFKKI